jgi:hypothetical protein
MPIFFRTRYNVTTSNSVLCTCNRKVTMIWCAVLMALLPTWVASFQHPLPASLFLSTQASALRMAPKYIDGQWVPQTKGDMPEAGYDVFGTLVRQGPKPAITRLTQPKDYEQAILKFMAQDQCDYLTAQGNMDAYLRNPADWTYQRMEDTKRGIEKKRDYVTIRTNEIVLVMVWSVIVVALVGRLIYSITNGVDFVRCFLPWFWLYCCDSFSHLVLFPSLHTLSRQYDWGFGPFTGSH